MIKNRKRLKIFLFFLIGVLTLSIGYASISAINMLINGNGTASVNQNNFKVHFTEAKEITGTTGVSGTTIIESNDTVASFNVTGLSKTGDYAEAEYTIKNDSAGIGAEISLNVTTTNTEFFKVTETIDDNKLQAGETTQATVKVEMIKTPIDSDVSTSVTATLIATPLENDSATGGSPASKASDDPVSFATDSWATIKTAVHNNNTSLYHVGDTKTVTIGANNYTVRIANKSTGEHCGDLDTAYSQTACGFVVEFVDIITTMQMQNSSTNVGGYPATLVYDYLNNTLPSQLPPELQSAIKPTRVISGYSTTNGTDSANFTSINQSLYLLSGEEVFGTDGGENNFYDTAVGTSHQLEYYSNNGVTYSTSSRSGTNYDKTIKQYNSSNTWWWLRPAYSSDSYTFAFVRGFGGWNGSGANGIGGVAPAFRIG